jgi:hypothetical protein
MDTTTKKPEVKYSANNWESWFVAHEDHICFRHPEAPDDIIRVKRKDDSLKDVTTWWHELSESERMKKLIWQLIDKGILFHPYEILN